MPPQSSAERAGSEGKKFRVVNDDGTVSFFDTPEEVAAHRAEQNDPDVSK